MLVPIKSNSCPDIFPYACTYLDDCCSISVNELWMEFLSKNTKVVHKPSRINSENDKNTHKNMTEN